VGFIWPLYFAITVGLVFLFEACSDENALLLSPPTLINRKNQFSLDKVRRRTSSDADEKN
jgi:hypothetical protein